MMEKQNQEIEEEEAQAIAHMKQATELKKRRQQNLIEKVSLDTAMPPTKIPKIATEIPSPKPLPETSDSSLLTKVLDVFK